MNKSVDEIDNFCKFLHKRNNLKNSRHLFFKLPIKIQQLFLKYSWLILQNFKKIPYNSLHSAILIFKIFGNKENKVKAIYKPILKLGKKFEKVYETAVNFERETRQPKTKREKQKYEKKFQRYKGGFTEEDPQYIFYVSLYSENQDSPLAITWLTEHGVFDGKQRDEIVKKYERLSKMKKLIR